MAASTVQLMVVLFTVVVLSELSSRAKNSSVQIRGNPGNRGEENGGNLSNGSSQSARQNTASVSAELIANSTTSSLS
jgi:hypothetical protein